MAANNPGPVSGRGDDVAATCCDKVYFCPTSGETECPVHGGFDVCCDRPDLHRPVASAAQDRLMPVSSHFGRDAWPGHRKQWFGPLGIGADRHEITLRFWLPNLSWVWGYWR